MGELTDILRREGRGPAVTATNPGGGSAEGAYQWSLTPDASGSPEVEISPRRRRDWRSRTVLVNERGAAAEQFRHLAVRVRRHFDQQRLRTLAISSSLRSEGKTTLSCNLSLAMASVSGGDRVALVELDLRRPRVAAGLDVEPVTGIEEVLAGQAPLQAARLRTQLPSLDLFLVKDPHHRAHEMLSMPDFNRMVHALGNVYRLVLIDTPPVLLVPDAPLLIPQLDACLFVARRGITRLRALSSALEMLPPEKLLGVFMNGAAMPVRTREYAYYVDE